MTATVPYTCPLPDCRWAPAHPLPSEIAAHLAEHDSGAWACALVATRHAATVRVHSEPTGAISASAQPAYARMSPPQVLVVNRGDEPLVTIHLDTGQVEFGPTYRPDEAARTFWEAVQRAHTGPEAEFGRPLYERINTELARGQKAEGALERVWALVDEYAATPGWRPLATETAKAFRAALDAEQPEPTAATALGRVLAECDRIERAVRANPQGPDFDGAYLACLRHIREAVGDVPPVPGEERRSTAALERDQLAERVTRALELLKGASREVTPGMPEHDHLSVRRAITVLEEPVGDTGACAGGPCAHPDAAAAETADLDGLRSVFEAGVEAHKTHPPRLRLDPDGFWRCPACVPHSPSGADASTPAAEVRAAVTEQAVTGALKAAMERLRATRDAYNVGDAYGKTFVPGLSRAVEVVQRVMLERDSVPSGRDAAETGSVWADPGDEAWGAVWQRGNWYDPTREMSTEARERAAAAVLRWMHALDAADGRPPRPEPKALRWWKDGGPRP